MRVPASVIIDTNVIQKLFSNKEWNELSQDEKGVLTCILNSKSKHTTPHVLAELSCNLRNKEQEYDKDFSKIKTHKNFMHLNSITEEYVSKNEIFDSPSMKFGITDSSLAILARKLNALLVSEDWALVGYCRKNSISACHIHELSYH